MKRIFCALALLLFAGQALAFDVPALKGRVNDNANLLTPAQVDQLNVRLKDIETGSGDGSQVVVLTLPSLDGESIDQVRNDVFHAWKLGQAGKDNGVLIVIAPIERKIGIEVGYGLEPYLTDGVTKSITDTKMKPHLKKGAEHWFEALDDGAAAVGAVITAREKTVPETKSPLRKILWLAIILALFVGGISLALMWARRREREIEEEARRADAATQSRRRTDEDARVRRLRDQFRPDPPRPYSRSRTAGAAATGAALGAAAASSPKPRRDDDSYSSSSSSSWGDSSSSSSDSGSSFSGGGGDSGGGGSSSDF